MDYIQTIKGVEYLSVGRDFNYLQATEGFLGLKLFPLFKSKNFKVAIAQLMKGHDIPVTAFVHALDSEARISDRLNYTEFKSEMFYIKTKLDQGEALRKKLRDFGLDATERALLEQIYDDLRLLISEVITGFERLACEVISTGGFTVNENGVSGVTVDFNVPAENKLILSGWGTASHDIFGDLLTVKRNAKGKIVRMITSEKIVGYMLNNNKFLTYVEKAGVLPSEEALKAYVLAQLKVDIVTYDKEYKIDRNSNTTYRFIDADTISFVTTRGELGKLVTTSTPAEDAGKVDYSNAFVTVHTYDTEDPIATWTLAGGVGLPVLVDPNGLYIAKVGA